MLAGLSQINVELSSVCKKKTKCGFCGHQDPAIHPNLKPGQMTRGLMHVLADELRPLGKNLVLQAHRDGDPLDASDLGYFLERFRAHLRSLVTHGETLAEKAHEVVDNCEAITVSIFRGDPDQAIQLAALEQFLSIKGDRLPRVYLKIVGGMSDGDLQPYVRLGVPFLSRRLHLPESNRKYTGGVPLMPEHGVCLDLLSHPSVAWDGRVYLCNRLDPTDRGVIGNVMTATLDAIWNGPARQQAIDHHLHGRRNEVPACASCQYYGIPAS